MTVKIHVTHFKLLEYPYSTKFYLPFLSCYVVIVLMVDKFKKIFMNNITEFLFQTLPWLCKCNTVQLLSFP
jgi:hypothetical protein